MPGPLCAAPRSEAASSSITSTPTPAIRMGTGSKRLEAPSPGRILPYGAGIEPRCCPGSSVSHGGRILLGGVEEKSGVRLQRAERYRWVPEHNAATARLSGLTPGGSSPRADESRGARAVQGPGDGTGCVSGGKWGLASQGCPGRPHREHPCLCPLLPRPVGPVEGAPGQQHVPD